MRKIYNYNFTFRSKIIDGRVDDEWHKLLQAAQQSLEKLVLEAIHPISWSQLAVDVVQKCSNHLQTLVVINLSSQLGDCANWPLDLSLLRHCTALQFLSLSHQPRQQEDKSTFRVAQMFAFFSRSMAHS